MSAHTLGEEVARKLREWAFNRFGRRIFKTTAEDLASEILALIDRPSVCEGWREAVAWFVQADDDAQAHGGLKDGQDNGGRAYQTASMECLLDKCRAMLAAVPSPPVGQERGGWRPMSELPERAYVVIARPLPNGQWSSFTAAVVPGEYDWPAGAMFMELVFPGRSALTKGEADA